MNETSQAKSLFEVVQTYADDEKYDDSIEEIVLPDEVDDAEEQGVKQDEWHLIAVEQHLVKRVTIIWNSRNGHDLKYAVHPHPKKQLAETT